MERTSVRLVQAVWLARMMGAREPNFELPSYLCEMGPAAALLSR